MSRQLHNFTILKLLLLLTPSQTRQCHCLAFCLIIQIQMQIRMKQAALLTPGPHSPHSQIGNKEYFEMAQRDFYFHRICGNEQSAEVIKSSWPAKIFLSSFSCQHQTFSWLPSVPSQLASTFFPQICHRSLPRKEKSVGRICLHDVVQLASSKFSTKFLSVIIAITRRFFHCQQ